jgi:NADH dehydrogenase
VNERYQVVILGGGFGGLYAAQSLKNVPVDVILIDRRNFHLFQPLLYQVATGSLSPANIASTLRIVLRAQKNARTLLAEVIDIDVNNRHVILSIGRIPYDTLIVATGSRHHYFGNDQWESLAPGLKTIEDAIEIRRRIFLAFETAEREVSAARSQGHLTFIIIGGGPTGVELAGALADIVNDTLKNEFRRIDQRDVQILLVEAADRILTPYPVELSKKAESFLKQAGVSVKGNSTVTAIDESGVTIKHGEAIERIPCRTVLWAAGVSASFLGTVLMKQTGAKLDRSGRLLVEPDLSLKGHPEVFAIGDLANYLHQTGHPLPGIAPVAMQQGRYVARLLSKRIAGKTKSPFYYKDRGNMAIVGRGTAVADLRGIHITGFWAWLAWLFVHLINLVVF